MADLTGFELYLEHKGVVVKAVDRLHLAHPQRDFEDFVEEGMMIYVNYFNSYGLDSTDAAEVTKFNKLAGTIVYKTLLRNLTRNKHRTELEERAFTPDPTDPTDSYLTTIAAPEAAEQLALLQQRLTPREQEVLTARLQQFSIKETASRLGLSYNRAYALNKQIQTKYAAMLAS